MYLLTLSSGPPGPSPLGPPAPAPAAAAHHRRPAGPVLAGTVLAGTASPGRGRQRSLGVPVRGRPGV